MSIQQTTAPAASTSAPASPATTGFRDPTALTRWLKTFLYINSAMAGLAVVSRLLELKLLNDMQAGRTLAPGAADSNDLRQQIIAGGRFISFIVTVVIFAIWIHRANYNARQLGATGMRFSPGWAVGWYFIPIAILWKLYLAIGEVWQTSAMPGSWQQEPGETVVP